MIITALFLTIADVTVSALPQNYDASSLSSTGLEDSALHLMSLTIDMMATSVNYYTTYIVNSKEL
jgi:hypothetical protein